MPEKWHLRASSDVNIHKHTQHTHQHKHEHVSKFSQGLCHSIKNLAISPVSRNIVHFHMTPFKTSGFFLPHSLLFVSTHVFSKIKDFINSDSSSEASLVWMSLTVVLFGHFRTFDKYIYNIHTLSLTRSRLSENSFVFIIPASML